MCLHKLNICQQVLLINSSCYSRIRRDRRVRFSFSWCMSGRMENEVAMPLGSMKVTRNVLLLLDMKRNAWTWQFNAKNKYDKLYGQHGQTFTFTEKEWGKGTLALTQSVEVFTLPNMPVWSPPISRHGLHVNTNRGNILAWVCTAIDPLGPYTYWRFNFILNALDGIAVPGAGLG